MPFRSKAQQAYMFIHHPKIAAEWEDKYGIPKDLPQHASADKKMAKAIKKHRRSHG